MSRRIDESTDVLRRAAGIINEYGDFIYRVIRSQLSDEALVDDVFQDFYLSIVSRPIPDDVENMESYLYRAVSNNILDAVRTRNRTKSNLKKYAQQVQEMPSSFPEQILENNEVTDRMFDMLRKHLSKAETQVFRLRFRDDHDTLETAEKMGVNSRTVSRYMSTGLKKIRCLLKGQQS